MRHTAKVREVPGVATRRAPRYPGRSQSDNEIELRCYWCGRVMAHGGYWTDQAAARELWDGHVVTLECSDGHPFEIDGRWLWDAVNEARAKSYPSVTVPRRYGTEPATPP